MYLLAQPPSISLFPLWKALVINASQPHFVYHVFYEIISIRAPLYFVPNKMDPVSISVSILAILDAIESTVKAAKAIYHAPEELESLLNDLTEGEIMVWGSFGCINLPHTVSLRFKRARRFGDPCLGLFAHQRLGSRHQIPLRRGWTRASRNQLA